MGKRMNFIVLTVLVLVALLFGSEYKFVTGGGEIDSGDTAWMLISSAFVLLMTPGLAFFYGGMVSRKNVISTLMQSFVALGVVSLIWVIVGFSIAFGDSIGGTTED